jgi:CheY-like chemotaxis protein
LKRTLKPSVFCYFFHVQTPLPAIAITDDDPDDRELLGEACRECDIAHPLTYFLNGAALLDGLRAQASGADSGQSLPVLVLLDLNMPVMDGFQTLTEIRRDPRLQHLPVVILSTSRAEDDHHRSVQLGATAFFSKPADFHSLLDLVRHLRDTWLPIAPAQRA